MKALKDLFSIPDAECALPVGILIGLCVIIWGMVGLTARIMVRWHPNDQETHTMIKYCWTPLLWVFGFWLVICFIGAVLKRADIFRDYNGWTIQVLPVALVMAVIKGVLLSITLVVFHSWSGLVNLAALPLKRRNEG